jgi:coenzyme F420 hydrogenase subunit delta
MNERDISTLPEYCTKETLILGCGNRLFGDDGFGSIVAERLAADYGIPEDVYVGDAGTGVRKLLFTLCLGPQRPRKIIILDAVDRGKIPGELFELSLDDVPREKTDDFSLHQAPSSNLAKELMDAGVDVRIIACQVGYIPGTIQPGLSDPVARAVTKICRNLGDELNLSKILTDLGERPDF